MMIENALEEVLFMYFYYNISSCKQSFIELNDEERVCVKFYGFWFIPSCKDLYREK